MIKTFIRKQNPLDLYMFFLFENIMKIGLLSTFPPEKCGVAIYTNNLYNGLKNKGIEIIRIGNKESEAEYKVDFKSFNLKKELKEIIEKEKIKLIHVEHNYPHFSSFFNLNLINCFSLKIPFVTTLHEVHYFDGATINPKESAIRIIQKNIAKKSSAVIVHTPKQKDLLEKRYGARNIHCIYHGLSLLPENKRNKGNLLFFGLISEGKGIEFLIEAMRHLQEYSLTIAGSVPKGQEKYKEMLLKKIKELNLTNVKTDLRWINEDEKWDYYRKADIVVLPYVWSPYQSGILHNALSCAIPAVVTKTGSLHEIAEIFRIGEIVEPKNPEAIAEAVRKVDKNYNDYRKGIEQYREKANWQNIGKKHRELYRRLIEAN
jgi:glycosyltransferase involved in cell wall biosynthesis